jgi:hypothetical protein
MVADEPLLLVVGQQAPPVGLRDDLPDVRRPAASPSIRASPP